MPGTSVLVIIGVRLEFIFFCAADRTYPVIGQFFEERTRLNFIIGIAFVRVIYIVADRTSPEIHTDLLFSMRLILYGPLYMSRDNIIVM